MTIIYDISYCGVKGIRDIFREICYYLGMKKKPGPKPLPSAQRRESPLLIRFRDSERKELERAAKRAGVRLTDLVRDAALERARAV